MEPVAIETVAFQNLAQLEELAKARLSEMAYAYYAGGSEDEAALHAARDAFGHYRFRPRVLRDVSNVDLATTSLGQELSMPILVAPTGFHGLAHPEGEVPAAQATADARTLFVTSTLANVPLERIAAAASGPKWFQLYVFKDRAITAELVKRAEGAGYKAIVLTVDTPVLGRRERDLRTGFHLPPPLTMGNFSSGVLAQRTAGTSSLAAFIASQFDASLTWADFDWLRSITKLPIIVKGILAPEDARLAIDHGAKAIIVSNHGGRQLDHSIAPLDALPPIAAEVRGRCELYMDGGVRRGTDVLKALALGARGVFLGRPILWGLAAAGRAGVAQVLEHMRTELATSLQILGVTRPADVDHTLISHV